EPIFSSILSIFFGAGLFLISTYFFLVERTRIKKEILALSPFNDKLDQQIVRRIVDAMRGVVFGALIVALLQGIFATIGFAIFGVPSPVLWGTIVMIAAQVPMIGASLVMIPAIAFLLISGKTAAAIGMAIWAIVVVGMIDNIISPYLIEGRTKMHALLILLSILGGLRFFGPIGFIIGPTVLASVMAIIELYKSGVWEQE
ncbi:MAG: AI-2E family transporter, partial [bacterium]|nr:AI-2E family transporter [bacterium]